MSQERILKEIETNKKYLVSFCSEMTNLVLMGQESDKMVKLAQSIQEVALKIEIYEGMLK